MKIFISYSTIDHQYKDKIKKKLFQLVSDKTIELFIDEQNIRTGDHIDERIKKEILNSDIILLLLSESFWDSNYIRENELPLILEQKRKFYTEIMPIVLNNVKDIEMHSELKDINAMPRTDYADKRLVPIDSFESEEKAYSNILAEINRTLLALPSKSIKLLKSKLVSNYNKKSFNHITFLDKKRRNIEDIFINLAIIKEKKELDKNEKEKADNEFITREAYPNTYEEIYKPKELIDRSKKHDVSRLLIFGKAGIGKTTLCKYIAYNWAKEQLFQEFNFIIYIALKELREGGIRDAFKRKYSIVDISEINEGTLFLLDGYDELDSDKKRKLKEDIEDIGFKNYIITSRPYECQIDEFSDINEQFEIIGFTNQNVEAYIDKFFTNNQSSSFNNTAIKLKNFLRENIHIKQHITYIPIMLEMICSLWSGKSREGKQLTTSINTTEIYTHVIESMLEKHEANKDNNKVYPRNSRRKIKNMLGKIAFEGLKENTISLDGNFLEEILDDSEIEFFQNNTIYSGFLLSSREKRDLLDNKFEFPHRTFQEYFAALHVSTLLKEKKQKEVIREYKFYPHMQGSFTFLGGLIKDKEWFLSEIESEPKDKLGAYEILSMLNFKSQMVISKVDKKRLESINNTLENWLKFTLNKEQNYEIFLEKLEADNQLINKEVINILTDRIRHQKVSFKDDLQTLYKLSTSPIINRDTRRKNSIKSALKILLKFKLNKGQNYETFLKKLETDNYEINKFINQIGGTKVWLYDQDRKILKSLVSIGKNNDKVENALFELIKDTIFSSATRTEIGKLIVSQRCQDDKIIDKLLELIRNNTIDICYRRDFINSLEPLILTHKIDSNIIRDVHNLKSFHNIHFQGFAVRHTEHERDIELNNVIEILVTNKRGNDKILDVILDFIKDDSIDLWYKSHIVYFLVNSADQKNNVTREVNNNEEVISTEEKGITSILKGNKGYGNILINTIKDNSIDCKLRVKIVKSLTRHGSNHDELVDSYIKLINSKTIDSSVQKELINSLIKLTSESYCLKGIVIKSVSTDFLIKKFSLKSFFEAFSLNKINLNMVVENALYKRLPLYLKDNNLCSVEKEIEIITTNKIDEKKLQKIIKKILI